MNTLQHAVALLAALLFTAPVVPQAIDQISEPHIEKKQPDDISGELWVTVAGRKTQVSAGAVKFWLIDGGRQIVYSRTDGSGGFENEGQSLWSLVPPKKPRKLLAEKYIIQDVKEFVAGTKRGLIVFMRDGGLGASHVAVVDVARGQVLSVSQARVLSMEGGTLRLGFFREGDWEQLNAGKSVVPYRERQYDLIKVLSRPVMKRN
jgi:hypothetical protein